MPKNVGHSTIHPCSSLLPHVGNLGSCLLPRFFLWYVSHSWIGAPGSFTVTIHPRWVVVCVFLPCMDSHSSLSRLRISFWVMICGWVSSPTFLWHSPPFSKLRNHCGLIFRIWGCCGSLLSHFGHDRAKNDLGIEFPNQSYVLTKLSPRFCSMVFSFLPQSSELLDFSVYVVVGIWTILEWEWRIGLLDKIGVFGCLIYRARGMDFFSTPPK